MTRPAILITGAARRIGAAIARRFGAEGWHVVVHYGQSRAEADALAASLPSAEAIQCDLADPDAAMAMVEELAARLPEWRVLVNSASVFEDDAGLPSPDAHARTMRINSEVPMRMAQAFLAHSRATGGRRVIAITDQKLANPNPDFPSYTMSKQALAATVPILAMSASRSEDRVYGIAPGAILQSYDKKSPEEFAVAGRLNLLGRHTPKDEVADAALFLAQGWVASGTTLFVNSGQHLLAQSRDVLYLAREGANS